MKETGKKLLEWYGKNKRKLPWRTTKDPYTIWISEIMLQQTRVDQGMDYFLRFIKRFPDVQALAKAEEEEVLKYWQGLGYYSRARNLHFSACYIVNELNGIFPRTYDEILKLKGVGPYTAAAIASIAYNLPHPVIDGNVFRIISRIFGIEDPINSTEGLKKISAKVNAIFISEESGDFNQAMMEFGALFCTPKNPQCDQCTIRSSCIAFKKGKVNELPKKLKTQAPKDLFIHYFVFFNKKENMVYIRKRANTGIWKNLYDFPSIDSEKNISENDILNDKEFKSLIDHQKISLKNPVLLKHQLSHKNIFAHFYLIPLSKKLHTDKHKNIRDVKLENLHKYPVSRLIDSYLSEHFEYTKSAE